MTMRFLLPALTIPIHWLLLSSISMAGEPSRASAPALSQAASLASACSGCHGSDSSSKAIVSLSGYSAERIREQFLAYREEPEGPSAMHRMARGYTQQQSVMIAEYLAR